MNDDESSAAVISTTIDQLVETEKATNPSLKFAISNKYDDIGHPVTVVNGDQIVVDRTSK